MEKEEEQVEQEQKITLGALAAHGHVCESPHVNLMMVAFEVQARVPKGGRMRRQLSCCLRLQPDVDKQGRTI